MEKFYSRHFGFRRVRVFNAGQPNEFVMLRLGAMCIELFPASNPLPEAKGGEQAVGFKHLALEVADLDQAVAELKADGIATDPIRDCSWVTPGMRVCFFNDPEGNRLELVQGYKDQFPA